MRCPFCGHLEDKVVDSRASKEGEAIRRRRECHACEQRFTTYERVEEAFPQIVKSDGSRQDYDRDKLRRGIRIACTKRPISIERIDAVVDAVERKIVAKTGREVSSDWIGSTVTSELRDLDPVAYIRFASVYRAFSDIQAFLEELRGLDEGSDAGRQSRGDGDSTDASRWTERSED
jgi:transcriptional repressor NrdR